MEYFSYLPLYKYLENMAMMGQEQWDIVKKGAMDVYEASSIVTNLI